AELRRAQAQLEEVRVSRRTLGVDDDDEGDDRADSIESAVANLSHGSDARDGGRRPRAWRRAARRLRRSADVVRRWPARRDDLVDASRSEGRQAARGV